MSVSLLTRGAARLLISIPLRRRLKGRFARAQQAAGLATAQVCISLSDDAELLQLNQDYAQEDHPTDVLSFAQPVDSRFPSEVRLLGDIIISVETAQRQANAGGHSLLQELLHLSVHGLCHLMGYDHATKEEEHVMFGYEAKLREQALGEGRIKLILAPATAE